MHPPPVPPELPDRTLRRIVSLSRTNAWSIVGFGGLGGVIAAVRQDLAGFAWVLLVIVAGTWELLGARRLRAGDIHGLRHMICAEVFLLAVIWAYAWLRVNHFDADAFWAELPAFSQHQLNTQLLGAGLDPVLDRPPVLQMMNLLVCTVLALVTLVYQGGLALYYSLKRTVLRQALLA